MKSKPAQRQNDNSQPAAKPRVFAMEAEENAVGEVSADYEEGALEEGNHETLSGTISINSLPFRSLFDTGATHSFISLSVVYRLGLLCANNLGLKVKLPSGDRVTPS